MREIKFRAWVLRDWALDGLMENMMDYDVESFHDPLYEYKQGNIILMQYTGLKDKNGKGIYEGDIIHMYSVMPGCDIDEIGIVKFIECAFMFEKIDRSNGWSIFNEATEIEVIGNIYENPELLNRKGEAL
ncbi:hypothetical protein CN446_14915 [Bacillus cereus]|nr:hypothetical protein CN446_14915 [Bacillus cereus]